MANNRLPSQVSLLSGASPKYCLDANIFFSFWVDKRRFPLEHYQHLWDYISNQIDAEIITSTEEVYREIKSYDDHAFQQWLEPRKHLLYVEGDMAVIRQAAEIINRFPQVYFQKPKNGADPFVVATAKVYNLIVVTEENMISDRNIASGQCPEIPNICYEFGVKCTDTLGMCKNEGFSLGPVYD